MSIIIKLYFVTYFKKVNSDYIFKLHYTENESNSWF